MPAPIDLSSLASLFNVKARQSAVKKMVDDRANRVIVVDGLAGSASSMLFTALPQSPTPYLIVVNDLDEAGYVYNDLCQLTGEDQVLLFPSGYKRDIKYGQIDAPQEILRTEVLNRWHTDSSVRWVVTYPEALAEKVAARESIASNSITLEVGHEMDLTEVAVKLRELGFHEVDYVYEPGQFSLRGSILDVYSFSNEYPYRIDFFGDEIDSVRTFNVETQLSQERLKSVSVINNMSSKAVAGGVSLLDYVGNDVLLIVRDIDWLRQRVEAIGKETMSRNALESQDCDGEAMLKVVDVPQFMKSLNAMRRLEFYYGESKATGDAKLSLHCSPQGIYHKNFDLISQSFTDFLEHGYTLYILSDSEKQIQRLRVIFDDRHDDIVFTPVTKTLHEGFVDEDRKMCVFTDHQIFDRFHKYNLKSERARSGKLALSLKELNQIESGDYIVHEDHGIGRFEGLLRTSINGTMQEMIKLSYLNGDVIFVSIHALHKLSKYRGKEGEAPKLSKLGTGKWQRIKSRTKGRLKDIARDLIKLYAQRREEKGFAFSPDGYLQQELEASFIYEDTPDQLRASQAVKADMERDKPMDRLVCGDVGFGKTEVAIRAAFKAAIDGKQTAVLVPTTVLAFQHYNTFRDRLKDFPVRIDYLSRARRPKDVKQIIADLADGKIDIIIGTHKLIGKTVKFKDLGLLVVDEEQKFGVAVKDKLKQLKVNVDTLTMSATPIPRTLQFSLMGARDLSTINTPPANRHPILISINALEDDVVKEAINFELSRNGQVFFVNNRIEPLFNLKAMINRLVPDARVVVAHGQMPPEQLEQRIIDFTNHDYDVLLATTIIESGIDMPNVNTIIINNAQNYGLSDLHQLRGRVGRSHRKAFCYLLVPPGVPLTNVARRRLQAIESFSDLGAGIHIAMQDLDIRGAGNLLGAEQSGFIADLGFETYQKILKEAVLELKTEEFADTFMEQAQEEIEAGGEEAEFAADCVIDTDLTLMFPSDYVPQENERISLYRELDNMESQREVDDFEARLEDRFGTIPDVGKELIRIVPLRRTARRLGIEKIALMKGQMYAYFVGDENKAYYQSRAFGRMLNYLQQNPLRCKLREKNGKRSMLIADVTTVLQALDILRTITTLEAL
ncbi:MAG: transcription-repair coupling factor [Muribaculaceae bacterium]|nr:transcription-repair coupling factor [Muribaculaceae bacterium]